MKTTVHNFAIAFAAVAAIWLLQCATSPHAPYVSELPIGDWTGNWTGDGAPQVLVVSNPLPYAVHVDLACTKPDGGDDLWETDVAANNEVRVLMQTYNKDEFATICSVTDWHRLDHARHRMRRVQWGPK